MLFSPRDSFTKERQKDVDSVESCSFLDPEVDNPMKEFVLNTDEQTSSNKQGIHTVLAKLLEEKLNAHIQQLHSSNKPTIKKKPS